MRWYEKLQRKLRNFAIPNLMIYLTVTMLFVYLVDMFQIMPGGLSSWIDFDRSLILQGQVWRVLTFLFVPSGGGPFSMFFFILFYVGIGQSLERYWGSSQFTLYYLIGVLGTIAGGFIAGGATNMYLNLSLFFAYAYLFPNEEFLLFFFFPVKAKYLAIADAVLYVLGLIMHLFMRDWGGVVSLLISLLNFFLFFGPGFFRNLRHRFRYRKMRREMRQDKYWDQGSNR